MVVRDFGQTDAWRRVWRERLSLKPFKYGPIPRSEYRNGLWRDAASTFVARPGKTSA